MIGKAFIIGAVALLSTSANAATIINGGFDDDAPPTTFVTAPPAGWTVTNGTVDHIGSYWQNQSGPGSVDLAGNGAPSTLSQTITDLIAGRTYRVDFWLAGNPDGGFAGSPAVKTLTVVAGASPMGSYSFDTTGRSVSNMGWIRQSYTFVAGGTSEALSFTSGAASGAYGPALDSVSIAAIPEPATWGMMILGFGVIGGAVRRRKAAAGRLAIA